MHAFCRLPDHFCLFRADIFIMIQGFADGEYRDAAFSGNITDCNCPGCVLHTVLCLSRNPLPPAEHPVFVFFPVTNCFRIRFRKLIVQPAKRKYNSEAFIISHPRFCAVCTFFSKMPVGYLQNILLRLILIQIRKGLFMPRFENVFVRKDDKDG